jgi:hypothetical protein
VRLFDLILALVVLAALVWIAGKEFPVFEGRSVPRPAAEATIAPSPAPSPAAPAASG